MSFIPMESVKTHPTRPSPNLYNQTSVGLPSQSTGDSIPRASVSTSRVGGSSPGAQTGLLGTARKIDQNTAFWEAYNKAGDLEDGEFSRISNGDLDSVLIFAGLFSATNTAFIIESCKTLKPDPADKTNELLQSLLSVIQNPQAAISTTPFVSGHRNVRVNACFFASLCCSLMAAYVAVLTKQWLTQYERDGKGLRNKPWVRGRDRHRKYEGRHYWHLEDVIVTLPTILQFSLFFFFIGLVDFLWPLSNSVRGIALCCAVTIFLFCTITNFISIYDASAPFRTHFSNRIRLPIQHVWRLPSRIFPSLARFGGIHTKAKREVDILCVSYLLERVTDLEDLEKIAEAFVSLQDDPEAVAITAPFIDFHLKPRREEERWVVPALSGPARSPLLKILNVLITKWKDQEMRTIRTSLHQLDTASLLRDLPGELRKAPLVDPTDTHSCDSIADILIALQPDHRPSASDCHETTMAQEDAWLEDDVTKNLERNDAAARNTLRMLDLTKRGCAERGSAWKIVEQAKTRSLGLKNIIHSTAWQEILSARAKGASGSPRTSRVLEWMAISDDVAGLADALEALPRGSEETVMAAQPLIGTLVETIVTSHLKPTFDEWWRLRGLHGQNRRSLLRILHVVVVRWRYLEADLNTGNPAFQLLHPLISSLRAELQTELMASVEDPEAVRIITEVCRSLSTLAWSQNDDSSTTAIQKISTDMEEPLQSDIAKPR